MKKTLFILGILLFCFTPVQAFLGQDPGIDLYKNIDKGFEELETIQHEYELSGQGKGIKETLNKKLEEEGIGACIEGEITTEEMQEITDGNLEILAKNTGEKCNSSVQTLTKVAQIIEDFNNQTQETAEEKTKQIIQISKIGVYSDGNIENSPFDLIKDIEDINNIIFASENNYEGEEVLGNEELWNCITGEGKCFDDKSSLSEASPETPDLIEDIEDFLSNREKEKNKNETPIYDTGTKNQYLCIEDVNTQSGLDPNTLASIINEIEGNTSEDTDEENSENENDTRTTPSLASNEDDFPIAAYRRTTDPWPCYNFFCITVEFITYQHKLLGGGQNPSIEYLLNRSNKHLKKAASTSLLPSQMTTNNFELGFKNLNLPDIFHMGFVITKKPAPIVDVQNPNYTPKENHKFTKDNILEEYYKNLGLDYERKNDLSLLKQSEKETKSILDSGGLNISQAIDKTQEYQDIDNNQEKKNEIFQKQIENKSLESQLEEFKKQFIELEIFSKSINEYIQNINILINEMDKKSQM